MVEEKSTLFSKVLMPDMLRVRSILFEIWINLHYQIILQDPCNMWEVNLNLLQENHHGP